MTTQVLIPVGDELLEHVSSAVREGLADETKSLPPWLFYDEAGSRLFDQITELPEYYLTRTERSILQAHAGEMIALAAGGQQLRLVEFGAGSADKTRIILEAAVRYQGTVLYEPVDVSASALEAARERIENELSRVQVVPRVLDYTREECIQPSREGERQLVLYIGSSIGNFEPEAALRLLSRVRDGLRPGDGILLGVDLVKDEQLLLDAYNDAAGVTEAFNMNMLRRLNRDLGADFDLDRFAHQAIWNPDDSRIEMHLRSRMAQTVSLPACDLTIDFARGETIHTENSYKFASGSVEEMLTSAGFTPEATWTDAEGWFAVCLGMVR